MGTTKKYWKGLEELKNDPEYIHSLESEFAEEIPLEKFLGDDALGTSSTNRRDFLKYLGFSVTAASLAACQTPVNKAIPYVNKPEEITPGIANWYASTFYDGSEYSSILVKTREGRPIKIEANELSPINNGGSSARVQASILSLYDSSRITGPYAQKAPSTWETVDKEIKSKLADIAAKGGNIRLLTSSVISPSTKKIITEFIAKYPTSKHITYDAISYSALTKANESTFGKAVLPSYNFDKANIIVSVGADFLGTWLAPTQFARQYTKNRKVNKEKKEMSRHIQFESLLSLSGSNADIRVPIKISEHGKAVVNLFNAIAKSTGQTALVGTSLAFDDKITSVAKALIENKGKSLVICGMNDVAVQRVVNGINHMLGNYGTTIDLENPSYLKQGDDAEFINLMEEMKGGKVNALFTYNVNPVYTSPASLDFEKLYNKVQLKVSFADRLDETAEHADYVCPDHNFLESWNDANPAKGHYSLTQPTISPLFSKPKYEGTRSAQESLLKWSGDTTEYYSYIKKYWETNIFPYQQKETSFAAFWNQSLHDGVTSVTVKETETAVTPKTDLSDAAQLIASTPKAGIWELALYEKIAIGNGQHANNPWLQELPDPISRVTWDNYVTMSPSDMKGKYKLLERQDNVGSVIELTVNGSTVKLPVYPQPGQAQGTLGVALGYGRTKGGKLSNLDSGIVGANVFPFVKIANGTIQYNSLNAEITNTTETHNFASTQMQHTLMGRDIVKETTLADFVKDPFSGNPAVLIPTHLGPKPPEVVNLWESHLRLGHKWGMSIDLNSCIGCGSCVVGCTVENNVAVVGKDQVMKTRDMAWLRIDRYYSSDMSEEAAAVQHKGAIDMYLEMETPSVQNPKVVFQPMLCQHCNHAPCETVCPVLATNHSSEGLNQMTYNRCVGTRYCANNCPYKVRRFNWFDYNANSDFANLNPSQDEIGRMVLNPDVVVRSRGVMEKCTMCVQRIQEGKLNAKKQGRKIKDGEINTACAQACPTNAIVFGDLNDAESRVSILVKQERNYYVLGEIGTQPNISYLTKVRNIESEKV